MSDSRTQSTTLNFDNLVSQTKPRLMSREFELVKGAMIRRTTDVEKICETVGKELCDEYGIKASKTTKYKMNETILSWLEVAISKLIENWTGPKINKKNIRQQQFWKLSKCWLDQNKCKFVGVAWIRIIEDVRQHSLRFSRSLYQSLTISNPFAGLFMAITLYKILTRFLKFPKTKDQPLLALTCLEKNSLLQEQIEHIVPGCEIRKWIAQAQVTQDEELSQQKKYNPRVKTHRSLGKTLHCQLVKHLENVLCSRKKAFNKLINFDASVPYTKSVFDAICNNKKNNNNNNNNRDYNDPSTIHGARIAFNSRRRESAKEVLINSNFNTSQKSKDNELAGYGKSVGGNLNGYSARQRYNPIFKTNEIDTISIWLNENDVDSELGEAIKSIGFESVHDLEFVQKQDIPDVIASVIKYLNETYGPSVSEKMFPIGRQIRLRRALTKLESISNDDSETSIFDDCSINNSSLLNDKVVTGMGHFLLEPSILPTENANMIKNDFDTYSTITTDSIPINFRNCFNNQTHMPHLNYNHGNNYNHNNNNNNFDMNYYHSSNFEGYSRFDNLPTSTSFMSHSMSHSMGYNSFY